MLKNGTAHDIMFFAAEDTTGFGFKREALPGVEPLLVIEPSGIVPRAATVVKILPTIEHDGLEIPAQVTEFGDLEDVPPFEEGVVWVVSSVCANAVKRLGRKDFATPADAVRKEGRVIGALGISMI